MVPIAFAELGTELEVEVPSGRTSAVVVQKPFIDPKNEIAKQEVRATSGAGNCSADG